MEKENFIFRYYSPAPFYYKEARVALVGKIIDGKLVMAASRCSASDNFCKKTGRQMAEQRLSEGKYTAIFPMKECSIKQFRALAEAYASSLVNDARLLQK